MARLIAAAVLALSGAAAQAADFALLRWTEDHRDLADPAHQATPLDGLKHIALGDDSAHYLSLGGQLRLKGLSLDAPLFGLGAARADGYWFQRLNLHGDWHAGPHLRVFVEIGDARVHGKDAPATIVDANRADLQLAFADLRIDVAGAPLVLRLGRQELAFDNWQRFVAVREGPNVRRAFDGVRLIGSVGGYELTAFAMDAVANRNDEAFDDRDNPGLQFSGLRIRSGSAGTKYLDGYWYRYSRADAPFGGMRAQERRDAFGLQSAGRLGRFDWDTEAQYQVGEFGDSDIRAWAIGNVFGYSFPGPAWKPRLSLQLDAASGDRHAGDDRLETFNSLFSRGSYFSQSGLTDFSNLVNTGLFLSVRPTSPLTLGFGGGRMARQTRADAAYAQPLLPIPRSTIADKHIGDYWRFNASYRCNRHLTLSSELLHYVPSAGLREVGADTVHYAEVVAKLLF